MRVIVRTLLDWDESKKRYTVLAEHSRIRLISPAYCKGASKEQNALAAQQADFYKTLQTQQAQQFAKQDALYSAIKGVYDPIIKGGPGQYGFNPAEDAAMRTQASEGTAANYQMASKAAAERSAAAGGGNAVLPSGVQSDITGKIAATAAADISQKQLGITTAGYETGRQNFNNATGVEMGIASGYNPLGYAGAATSAGNSAFSSATEIQKANAAASPWGTIGGLVGGIAGSFATGGMSNLTKGLGFLGNAGSSNKFGSTNSSWDAFDKENG